MKKIQEIILEILSKSEEFNKYYIKTEEKKFLNELNKNIQSEIKYKLRVLNQCRKIVNYLYII